MMTRIRRQEWDVVHIGTAAGPTRTGLARLGRRYAAAGHTVVAWVAVPLGMLAAPAATYPVALTVGAVVLAWSGAYVLLLHREGPGPVFVVGNVAVVALVAVTQGWTVPASVIDHGGGGGWAVVLSSVSVVLLQLTTTVGRGAAAVVVIGAALLLGVALSPGGMTAAAVGLPCWILVEAALARVVWSIVQRAADTADAALAGSERARREAAVSAARRAQERAHCATLHDTAATTLLMIGLGEVRSDAAWLRGQAERDLLALDGILSSGGSGTVDLAPVLEGLVREQADVAVDLRVSGPLLIPHRVADAVSGAVREALNNVARHAGVGDALVRAQKDDDVLTVEVVDGGAGFDAAAEPPARHGVAKSIVGRMTDAGGHAVVTSGPGAGTTVRLAWPVG